MNHCGDSLPVGYQGQSFCENEISNDSSDHGSKLWADALSCLGLCGLLSLQKLNAKTQPKRELPRFGRKVSAKIG